MMSSLFIGAMGMKAQSAGLNNVGNNLSNVSTVGYKKQSMLFQDMMSQELAIGSTGTQGFNQLGLGVAVGSVRTVHTQGSFEPGSSVTDLAISGKGFFQMTSTDPQQSDEPRYTRAGNFRFDPEGYLRDPTGLALSGQKVTNGVVQGTTEPIHIDFKALSSSPPKPSANLDLAINLGSNVSKSSDETDPYFSLVKNWKGLSNPPLASGSYAHMQELQVVDSAGNTQNLKLYVDGAPKNANGNRVFEYVVAVDPKLDGAKAGTEAAGLLMSGTMTFNSSGQLMDMTAFKPGAGNPEDLAGWTQAPLVNGVPQLEVSINNGTEVLAPQTLTLNLGIQGVAWANPGQTAADIKTTSGQGMTAPIGRTSNPTTARDGAFTVGSYKQDGKVTGDLSNVEITADGKIQGRYTNGDTVDFYEIPLFRFTSEDGLRHEGNNMYSAPEDKVGKIEFGRPGSENYGSVISSQLETSNVDMSMEMVNLIISQRSFQMNSKTVTTADTMLQKALELKRN